MIASPTMLVGLGGCRLFGAIDRRGDLSPLGEPAYAGFRMIGGCAPRSEIQSTGRT